MNQILQLVSGASAASVLAFSALAQVPGTTNNLNNATPGVAERMSNARRTDRLNGAVKASALIGLTVNNRQDEKLGKVEDLGVDVESGRIVQVILSTGGVFGIGDTLIAVPPGALHHDVAQKVLHLDADKEKLKHAPKFDESKWVQSSDSNHLSAIYHYYGEASAYSSLHTGASANPSQTRLPGARLAHVQKASKLIGMPVKNLQNEKIGDVENFVVDLPSGRIVALVVTSGGFLGMGNELSAIPPTALRFNANRDTLQLDASKEMLSNAPHFKAHQWPEFDQPSYAGGIYRAYQVEPYFSTQADNTERNVRDRENLTLTPFDQGNSKRDVELTAQIRKEIIATKDMSVNAQNVKIITNEGRVTLRGPVNSAEEKRLIGKIAARIARTGNVDNQLEVKLITGSLN